ncbi:hypothetical protein HG531_012894 [Fusarium graminearum]|nr:hypothetical protein HG531_012894 [Fusarium graminearum]
MKEGDVTIFGGSVLAEDVDILRIDFKAVTVHEDEADNHGLVVEVDEEKRVVKYETIITAVVKKTIDRIKVVSEITDMDAIWTISDAARFWARLMTDRAARWVA